MDFRCFVFCSFIQCLVYLSYRVLVSSTPVIPLYVCETCFVDRIYRRANVRPWPTIPCPWPSSRWALSARTSFKMWPVLYGSSHFILVRNLLTKNVPSRPVERFRYDDKNVFTVAPLERLSLLSVLGAMGLGFSLSLLFFMDQNITSAMVNNPCNKYALYRTYTVILHENRKSSPAIGQSVCEEEFGKTQLNLEERERMPRVTIVFSPHYTLSSYTVVQSVHSTVNVSPKEVKEARQHSN